MSNLTPEQRVNKLGHVVTKHVRAALPAANESVLPPVTVASEDTVIARVEKDLRSGSVLAYMFLESLSRMPRMRQKDRDAMLATLHPETLMRCETVGKDHSEVFERAIEECLDKEDFRLLNNMGVFIDLCDEAYYYDFMFCVAGLNGYSSLEDYVDYSAASDEAIQSARALLQATFGLQAHRDHMYVDTFHRARTPHTGLISPLLTKLIVKRPEDVETIISLLLERSLFVDLDQDIRNLEELLDSINVNALSDGAL